MCVPDLSHRPSPAAQPAFFASMEFVKYFMNFKKHRKSRDGSQSQSRKRRDIALAVAEDTRFNRFKTKNRSLNPHSSEQKRKKINFGYGRIPKRYNCQGEVGSIF